MPISLAVCVAVWRPLFDVYKGRLSAEEIAKLVHDAEKYRERDLQEVSSHVPRLVMKTWVFKVPKNLQVKRATARRELEVTPESVG